MFTVTGVSKKITWVTDGIIVKPFNISAILNIASKSHDVDLKITWKAYKHL